MRIPSVIGESVWNCPTDPARYADMQVGGPKRDLAHTVNQEKQRNVNRKQEEQERINITMALKEHKSKENNKERKDEKTCSKG